MYVGNWFDARTIWFWAGANLLQVTVVSTLVYVGQEWLGWRFLSIPFLPIATIGTAVAFYIGFKNSQSYERLTEGRRLWGAMMARISSGAAASMRLISSSIVRTHSER